MRTQKMVRIAATVTMIIGVMYFANCGGISLLPLLSLADDQITLSSPTRKVGDVVFAREPVSVIHSLPKDEATTATGHFATQVFRLPVEKIAGTQVQVTAMVKAENVVKPPQVYNGIKCMIHTKSPSGDQWRQQDNLYGTFDWKPVSFDVFIEADTTVAELVLGIENTTGTASFKEVTITITGMERYRPTTPKGLAGDVYRGHSQPRLRGVMIQPKTFEEADIKVLADWKVNLIRWQFLWGGFPNGPADTASVEEYIQWMETECQKLDRILPLCKKYGIYVVLDLHTPPGGRNAASEMPLFEKKELQDTFVLIWEKLATRYKNNDIIWGYDLLNEPVEGTLRVLNPGHTNWRELVLRTIQKIRAIDPDRALIIEPAPWGSPAGLRWFEPIDSPNIVYSVHMYIPHHFTHQGVHSTTTLGETYPGKSEGKDWDKEGLRRALKPAIDFANDHGVHIFLGEFSVIRWAPEGSGVRYLKDCIDIFEENGWDWTYHAFREWDGWSLEHGPNRDDRRPTTQPADRLRLMKEYFEKNLTP